MGNNASSPVDGDTHSALSSSPSAQAAREQQHQRDNNHHAHPATGSDAQAFPIGEMPPGRKGDDHVSSEPSDAVGGAPHAGASSTAHVVPPGQGISSSSSGTRRPRPASFSTSASSSSLATDANAHAHASGSSSRGDVASRRPLIGRRMLSMLSSSSSSSSLASTRPATSRTASYASSIAGGSAAVASSSPSPFGLSAGHSSPAGPSSGRKDRSQNDKKRRRLSNLLLRRSTFSRRTSADQQESSASSSQVPASAMEVDAVSTEASRAEAASQPAPIELAPPIDSSAEPATGGPSNTIEPLTTTDPLLSDRLATLSTIRDVLGADVVRSLPTVRRSMESLRRDREGAAVDLPPLPESTVSLLRDLEIESTRSRPEASGETRQEVPSDAMPSSEAASTDSFQTARAVESSSGPLDDVESAFAPPRLGATASAPTPTSQPDRIRNVANRLGGWLGIGYGSTPVDAAGPSGGSDSRPAAMEVDSEGPEQPATSNASAPVPSAADPPSNSATPERIPVGAFMIVQGFVQTSMPNRSSSQANDTSDEAAGTETANDATSRSETATHRWGDIDPPADAFEPRRPASESDLPVLGENDDAAASRRSSLFGRPRPAGLSASEGAQPTFTQQARMLGGLLGLAAAATASQLLSPSDTPATPGSAGSSNDGSSAARSGRRSTIEALRNRLRPQNLRHAAAAGQTGLSASGFEEAVRDYMRQAMRENGGAQVDPAASTSEGDGAEGTATPRATSESEAPPPDPANAFETFLQTMQADFVRAMSDYAGQDARAGGDTAQTSTESQAEDATTAPGTPADTDQASAPGTAVDTLPQTASATNTSSAAETSSTSAPLPGTVSDALPAPVAAGAAEVGTFQPSTSDSLEATEPPAAIPPIAPADSPNSLNFFRMYQFPARPRQPGQPNQTDPEQAPLVPVVLIGVRSLPHDPTRDGQNPLAMTPGSNEILPHAQDDASTWPTPPPRPMDPNETRTRWMERLRSWGRSRRNRMPIANRASAAAEDENIRNYLLWIVGGNYPVGHPILTIPNLITGELDHDDLWALAQILGQVKPPVATKEDIAKSGLEIIKGGAVQQCLTEGKIRENCAERCLVCLEDYEADQDCRIMACKHAFHAECIDRWLEVGRNSCPACRQAGVQTQKDQAASAAAATTHDAASTDATPPLT